MKIPKTFLLFFILIMLIMPISSLGLVSSSEDVAMDNPYGEGRWRLKNAGIQILYNHEEEDYDYLVKNSSFSTNKISIETIEESQNHVEVLLNLEIGFVTSLDRSDYEEHLEEGPIDEELLDAVHIGYDMYIDKDEAELLDDDEGWLVKEEDVKRYRLEKDDEKINIYSIQFEERIDFDYTELRFQIDKESNDATLVEEDHSEKGARLGFFPFLGFLEENPYENTYDYIFGGETNSVSKSADWIISYPDPEDFPDEPHDNDEDFVQPDMIEKNIGSTYFLNTEKRMTIDREKVMEDSPEITRRGLSLNYKRDGQSLYPADGELCLPAEFFIRNTSAEEMVYIDIDYEYNEEEAVEYLQSLRPRDDDEEEATFDEYKFLAIPAAVALIGGYLAYKNKKGG